MQSQIDSVLLSLVPGTDTFALGLAVCRYSYVPLVLAGKNG